MALKLATAVQKTVRRLRRSLASLGLAGLLLVTSGCSIRQMAVNTLADALSSSSSSTFTNDEDPELIRDALPFALKTLEALLAEAPEHEGLLLAACKGFVLYGVGFVEFEADRLEMTSYRQAKHQRERALKLYLRARKYCFRALDLTFPGASQVLSLGSGSDALQPAKPEHVSLLYWTAASWGATIARGLDQPELVADLPAVRVLLERALDLDEDYDRGALHEAMMLIEIAEMDSGIGSLERAREHYQRALVLNQGNRASTYVVWAEQVSVREQNRKEFVALLEKALAVDLEKDPEARLINIIQQDNARWLLDQADDLFLDDFEAIEGE